MERKSVLRTTELLLSDELELAYRAKYLPVDIRQFKIFAGIVLVGLGVFVRSDFLANGWTPPFYALIAGKFSFALATVLLFIRLSIEKNPRRYDLLAFCWTIVYSVMMFVIDMNRPPDYTGSYLANLLNILGFYLLIPNTFSLRIVSAFLFTGLVFVKLYLHAQHIDQIGLYAVIVCLILGNVVGIVESSRINRLRRKEFRAQEELNDLIRQRERLIRETNHRVKNNLTMVDSLLGMQYSDSENEVVREHLEESRARIQSIRAIHDTLANAQSQNSISMAEFLRDLARSLFNVYQVDARGIEFRAELADFDADPKIASPCGMIVTELITNALKYAFPDGRPGSITLKTTREGGRCVIVIQDDGIGLPASFDLCSLPSLGLSIVTGYVEQLHGILVLEKGPGAGFRIEFPLPPSTTPANPSCSARF